MLIGGVWAAAAVYYSEIPLHWSQTRPSQAQAQTLGHKVARNADANNGVRSFHKWNRQVDCTGSEAFSYFKWVLPGAPGALPGRNRRWRLLGLG